MALRYARRKPETAPVLATADDSSAAPAPMSQGCVAPAGHSRVKLLHHPDSTAENQLAEAQQSVCLPAPGTVRGLILDADLVLSAAGAWCRELALLVCQVRREFDASSTGRLWRNLNLPDALRGRREIGDAVDDYLRRLRMPRGQRDEVLAASLPRWREGEAQLHFLPGARETIRRLVRAGADITLWADATITGAELALRIGSAGLSGAIRAIVTSVDVDRVLPDPRCYQSAASQLGLGGSEMLFLADDEIVLAGAVSAGLQVVAVGDGFGGSPWRVARLEQLAALFDSPRALRKAG